MQRILKLKYQNAVTQVNLSDVDSPVIFVGGRRRNRKKRRPRNAGLHRQKSKHAEKPGTTAIVESDGLLNGGLGSYPVSIPVVSCLDIEEPLFMATTTTGGPDNTTEPPELTKLTDEPVVTSQPRRLVRTTSDDSGIYDEDTEHGPTSENEDNREDTDSDRGTDSELDLVEVDLSDETTHTEEADAESRETNAVVETQPSSRAGLMPPFMFGDFSETDEGDLETAISDNNKEHYTTAELPTVLRDREPLDIVDAGDNTPARLILDQLDDDDDVVLFDAHINQKLSLTSNPLYEYTLLEETRRYQAGYTAPFNSVDVIQTCQPATSSRVVAAGRESGTCPTSPTEEKACCTIL